MNARTKNLRDLFRGDLYVVDPSAVAEAMIVRTLAQRVLPEMTFRGETQLPQVRSFRPHRGARSFRLTRGERRPSHPPRAIRA